MWCFASWTLKYLSRELDLKVKWAASRDNVGLVHFRSNFRERLRDLWPHLGLPTCLGNKNLCCLLFVVCSCSLWFVVCCSLFLGSPPLNGRGRPTLHTCPFLRHCVVLLTFPMPQNYESQFLCPINLQQNKSECIQWGNFAFFWKVVAVLWRRMTLSAKHILAFVVTSNFSILKESLNLDEACSSRQKHRCPATNVVMTFRTLCIHARRKAIVLLYVLRFLWDWVFGGHNGIQWIKHVFGATQLTWLGITHMFDATRLIPHMFDATQLTWLGNSASKMDPELLKYVRSWQFRQTHDRAECLKILGRSLRQGFIESNRCFLKNEKQQLRTDLTDKHGLANMNSIGRHFEPQLFSSQTKFNTCAAIEWRCILVFCCCVFVVCSLFVCCFFVVCLILCLFVGCLLACFVGWLLLSVSLLLWLLVLFPLVNRILQLSLPSWKSRKKHKSKRAMRYHSTRSDLFGAPVANLWDPCGRAGSRAKKQGKPSRRATSSQCLLPIPNFQNIRIWGGSKFFLLDFLVSKVLEKLNCGFLFVHVWRVS